MMATGRRPALRIAPKQFFRHTGAWLLRVVAILELWSERRRQRRALRGLSDHMLKDVGLSRGQAEYEGRRPFWR